MIICKELKETMDHSIKLSLKASALSESLPGKENIGYESKSLVKCWTMLSPCFYIFVCFSDVSEHLETVQQHYNEGKGSQEGDITS